MKKKEKSPPDAQRKYILFPEYTENAITKKQC